MATKSKKANKDNKNVIIGICAAVALVVVVIVTVVLVMNSNTLNDSYFVSDNTKYVFTLESNESDYSEGEIAPVKTHLVYTYEGDKITSMKSYSQYADEATAKKAFDAMKEAGGEEAEDIELKGKYVIATAKEDTYKDLTASSVKQQLDFMESLKNANTDETENVDEVDESETSTEEE